jgi:hypothetical protein
MSSEGQSVWWKHRRLEKMPRLLAANKLKMQIPTLASFPFLEVSV